MRYSLLLFLGILFFSDFCFAKDFIFFKAPLKIKGQTGSVSATVFDIEEGKDFDQFADKVEDTVESIQVVMQNTPSSKNWLLNRSFKKLRYIFSNPDETGQMRFDKEGVLVMVTRTALSSSMWIFVGDFSFLQDMSIFGLQFAVHYIFSFKGWGLDVMNYNHKKAIQIGQFFNSEFKDSRLFQSITKYSTEFAISYTVGTLFMGIYNWQDLHEVFSHSKIYGEIFYFTSIGLFATGSWKVFLANQKEKLNPLVSNKTGMSIYRMNGLLSAVAYPLMINGYVLGDMILGTLAASGLVAVFKGETIGHNLKKMFRTKSSVPYCRVVFNL